MDRPLIENWCVITTDSGRPLYLEGEITRHPHQDEFKAQRQRTSILRTFAPGLGTATTQNTHYRLGKRAEWDRAEVTGHPYPHAGDMSND